MYFLNPPRLPTGDPSGEYQTLYNNYNSYTAMTDTAGPHFILSGYRYGASPYDQGANGYNWSSLAYTRATHAYNLSLDGTNSTVYPANNNGNPKRLGFPLRCLALLHQKRRRLQSQIHATSQPVALLENTKLSTITIIAILL